MDFRFSGNNGNIEGRGTWNEPRHEKTCLYHMQTTKAQISLRLINIFVVLCLDSVMPLLAKAEISRPLLVSVAEQTGLSLTWPQTTKTGFLVKWLTWGIVYTYPSFVCLHITDLCIMCLWGCMSILEHGCLLSGDAFMYSYARRTGFNISFALECNKYKMYVSRIIAYKILKSQYVIKFWFLTI